MAMSVQQGDLPQEENTMKRLFAGTLALVMTCGLLFSGCGKQMTPEEEAASQEAAISQQLQDEENKTGLKRLISNNLTEYEQPVHDFIEGLQDGDAEKTATALGVPNTFGEKLQDWVVVNDFETFQKTDMTNICLNSAKEGSKAAINVFMKAPEEVTADTSPDYTLTAEYTNGAWVLNPPTGILTDYSFTVPNNKVSFQGTDLSSYTAKNAETGVWTVTLPRALDLDSDAAYVISTDMGDFNGRVYQAAADGNKNQMLLADIDSDTRDAYQSKLSAVMKEVYRLLSIGAGESDFSNVLLDSNEISNCVPEPVDSDDDVEAIQANADKKALGASVTSITVAPDDTIEGYPDAYTYRLDGNDGVKMNVKLKVSTTNGDAHMKATIGMRIINGAWKIVSIDAPTCNISDIYDALLHNDLDKWEANFKYVPLSHPAASAWAVFKGMGERVQPNIVGGLNTRLQLFMTYKVRRVISNDDIRLANLGAEKTALFLIISDDNASMQLLSSLLLSFLFKDLKEAFDAVGGEGRIPVNVVADELANTGVWPNFEKTIATARSRKIAVSLILQSLPQLTQLYGEENAETIIGCCNTMLVLGCNDKYTAEYISDKSGIVTIRAKSVSDTRASSAGNRGVMQGYSLSEGDGKRNLVNPDEVQHLDKEQILIMTNGQNMLEAKRFGFIHHPLFNDPHFVPTKWAELPKTADLYPNARKHDAIESRESSFGDIQRQKEINTDITQKRSEERMKPRLSKKDLLATDEPAPKKKNAFKK